MRLKILSDDEIDALYGRPRFTQEERVEYFTLSAQEKVALAQLHSLKSKVFFILQLGYFKARRMFFVFGLKDAVDDAAYVRDKYFSAFSEGDTEIAETTRLKQQRLILDLCKYRNADAVVRRKLEVRAGQRRRFVASLFMSSENSCTTWQSSASSLLDTAACRI